MPITLYDAVVPSQLQILGSIHRLIGKAEAFCAEKALDPAEIIEARVAPDMFPFGYQVRSVTTHSFGAIEGVRRGTFSPDRSPHPTSFAALSALVEAALTGLQAVTPEELESVVGRDMRFAFGDFVMDFTAENFLLSFSQPNFYFHATTAYGILRGKGLEIGKRDYIGAVRKTA